VTQLEIRAMLARVNARPLRIDAGIRQVTVACALNVTQNCVAKWERQNRLPYSPEGLRWVRVIAGLERHARATAEIAAEIDEAA
jgi:DNA-binding transcriptional regulator YiaG